MTSLKKSSSNHHTELKKLTTQPLKEKNGVLSTQQILDQKHKREKEIQEKRLSIQEKVKNGKHTLKLPELPPPDTSYQEEDESMLDQEAEEGEEQSQNSSQEASSTSWEEEKKILEEMVAKLKAEIDQMRQEQEKDNSGEEEKSHKSNGGKKKLKQTAGKYDASNFFAHMGYYLKTIENFLAQPNAEKKPSYAVKKQILESMKEYQEDFLTKTVIAPFREDILKNWHAFQERRLKENKDKSEKRAQKKKEEEAKKRIKKTNHRNPRKALETC